MPDAQGGLSPGTQVGDYELLGPLGAGGMGQVYAARHGPTGAPVALKTLVRVEPELVLRLQREAEAQARVDAHPNVVRIHTCGVHQGRPYLVMDRATGGDLEGQLQLGPLAPTQAAELVAVLARALEHCHQHGVLHRDLKPANVLFDDSGRPLLVDFGLASLTDANALTQTGTLLGTPAYMAPEQAAGQTHAVGPSTDVYGLGALLYRCLTGQPPHQGRSHMDTARAVLQDEPVRPSALRPGVPPALERICLAALSKRPQDRPPSAAALAEALEAFLAGSAVAGLGRRRMVLAALLGALALGLAAAAWRAPAPEPPGPSPEPTPTLADRAPASPKPPPALTPLQRRLLEDPRGLFRELLPRFDAGDHSVLETLGSAVLLAAPPPRSAFLEEGDPGQREQTMIEVSVRWAGQQQRLPRPLRRPLEAISLVYRDKQRELVEAETPHEIVDCERALIRLHAAATARDWGTLETDFSGSPATRLSTLLERLAQTEPWYAFAVRVRVQRALYDSLRDWSLHRWHKLGDRVPLLEAAAQAEPLTPAAARLRMLAQVYALARSSEGFQIAPRGELDPTLFLLDTPTDRFLANALGYLLAESPQAATAEAALRGAGSLTAVGAEWPGALLQRVLEAWLPGQTLRAWRGERQALESFLAFDRPELFRDPRPVAVLRAEAMLLAQGQSETSDFVGEDTGPPAWWEPHGPEQGDRDDLYRHWRGLLACEISLQRPHGEVATILLASLPQVPDPSTVEDPFERAFQVHVLHLRAILDVLGHPTVAPTVPTQPDLGRAAAYLPPWRSVEHTRRTIQAMRQGGWRPWTLRLPAPPPD